MSEMAQMPGRPIMKNVVSRLGALPANANANASSLVIIFKKELTFVLTH